MSGLIQAEMLDRFIRIEKPQADTSFGGAGTTTWTTLVDAVRAQVQDVLPSRAERMDGGITLSTGRARVRMRWRDDITADMRFVMSSRIMDIISGPAELGRRDGLEFIVETSGASGPAT